VAADPAITLMNSRRFIHVLEFQKRIVAVQIGIVEGLADVRFGSKADMCVQKAMSALPPRADMCGATRYVRFGP
jgi:hypothetical protein